MKNTARISQPSAELVNKLFNANNQIEEHFQKLDEIFKIQFPDSKYNKFNSINKTFLACQQALKGTFNIVKHLTLYAIRETASIEDLEDEKMHREEAITNVKFDFSQVENRFLNLDSSSRDMRAVLENIQDEPDEYDKKVETLSKQVKGLTDKLNRLETNDNTFRALRSSTPWGNDLSTVQINKQIKIPTFENIFFDKPLKYLNDLKEYIQCNNNQDFKIIINNSLKKSASDWWHITSSNVTNFQDFENIFKQTFWNSTIQEFHEKKLAFGKYNSETSKISATQYATSMAAIGRDLNNNESDIVKKISRHFDDTIKNRIRSSASKTFADLLEARNEYDAERPRKYDNKTPKPLDKPNNSKQTNFEKHNNNRKMNNYKRDNNKQVQAIVEVHKYKTLKRLL